MIFTKEQIEEIKRRLSLEGIKDTEFLQADVPVKGTDIITVVQNGENRKCTLSELISFIKPGDGFDISDDNEMSIKLKLAFDEVLTIYDKDVNSPIAEVAVPKATTSKYGDVRLSDTVKSDSTTVPTTKAVNDAIDTRVDKAIKDLVNDAPEAFDTLKEIADYIEDHKSVEVALTAAIGKKADKTTVDALTTRVTEAEKDIDTLESKLQEEVTRATTRDDIHTKDIAELKSKVSTNAANITNLSNTKADNSTVNDISTKVTNLNTEVTNLKNSTVKPGEIADMATKTWVNQQNYLREHQSLADYAKTADVNSKISSAISDLNISQYATKSYVDSAVSSAGSSYTLPTADENTLGGVKSKKTGTTPNRDYAVEVNTDGTMKVNVPWEAGTTTTAPSYTGGKGVAVSGTSIALKEIKPSFSQTPSALSVGIADEDDTLITNPLVTVPNATNEGPGVVSLSTINSQMSSKLGLAVNYSGGSSASLTLKTDGSGENTVNIPVSSSSSGGSSNYVLPSASDDTLGGVKTGYQESAPNYAVRTASDKMYVTVPTASRDGGVSGTVTLTQSLQDDSMLVPSSKVIKTEIDSLKEAIKNLTPSSPDSPVSVAGGVGIDVLANTVSANMKIIGLPSIATGVGIQLADNTTDTVIGKSYTIPTVDDKTTNIPGVISIDKVKSIVSESNSNVTFGANSPGNDTSNVNYILTGNGFNAKLSLPHAKTNSPGLVRLGYESSGADYGVKMDDNGRIYVTVPNASGYTAGPGINVASGSIGLNLKADYTQTVTSCGLTINDATSNTEIAKVEFPLASSAAVAGMMTKAQATKLDGISTASETKAGLIRTNYTTSGNNYAVKVNGSGDAYVTVPASGGSDDKTYVAPYYLSADSLKSSSSSDSYIAGVMSNINSGKIAYVQATRSDSTLIKLNPYDSTSFTYEYEGTTYKVVVSGNGYTTTKLIDRSNINDGLVIGDKNDRYTILQSIDGLVLTRDKNGQTDTLITSKTLASAMASSDSSAEAPSNPFYYSTLTVDQVAEGHGGNDANGREMYKIVKNMDKIAVIFIKNMRGSYQYVQNDGLAGTRAYMSMIFNGAVKQITIEVNDQGQYCSWG